MDSTVSVLASRPDLADAIAAMPNSWPTFMTKDPIATLFYNPITIKLFADYVLACQDRSGAVVAVAYSIPLYLPEGEPLPTDGWDGAIRRSLIGGSTPNSVCALEISVAPGQQSRGLSSKMLAELGRNARRLGYGELVAPLRPNGKNDIYETMETYAHRTRPDGLPVDPWLRVHVRAGGVIDSVAVRSMVIPGTLDEWREWTGLSFDRAGPVEVPGALTPVLCDLKHGTAVYTEPNVWVRHNI
ncbi:hypothetical protein QMK17_20275 [Rhodococcus sp. G-MC3]|uniref:hypothetical protein n=1 Tax=Rhodococcus sp. G-MC3 TaxID=3046209 RepID=UPI0024BA5C6D|nr:hypothetical protein [Rhodococcus sp. G-MC3]MDJ0395662.1 hypothetical protein [Rhodococcus sp. G-MC3]